MGDYDALRPIERERLERFAAAFEDVDPLDYEQFAGTTASDDEIELARAVVLRAIGSGSRRSAVQRAVGAFTDAASRGIARRWRGIDLLLGFTPSSIRVDDRVRLRESLERAVAAVVLWDELTETERAALLGPWAPIAERAVVGGP